MNPSQKHESRNNSPSAEATVNDRTGLFVAIFAFGVSFLALGISITSVQIYEGRQAAVLEQNRIMEREVRIMQDDIKYVRAYLSARGVSIPANHEEAEDK